MAIWEPTTGFLSVPSTPPIKVHCSTQLPTRRDCDKTAITFKSINHARTPNRTTGPIRQSVMDISIRQRQTAIKPAHYCLCLHALHARARASTLLSAVFYCRNISLACLDFMCERPNSLTRSVTDGRIQPLVIRTMTDINCLGRRRRRLCIYKIYTHDHDRVKSPRAPPSNTSTRRSACKLVRRWPLAGIELQIGPAVRLCSESGHGRTAVARININ